MLVIIQPIDPSTSFLSTVIDNIKNAANTDEILHIKVEASEESHDNCLRLIETAEVNSTVLFLGHGQDNCLFGGHSDDSPRKALITIQNVQVFQGKNLFSFSCNSTTFLKNTFRHSAIINSIGFGSIPTEEDEIRQVNRLIRNDITDAIIESYKVILIELLSDTFVNMAKTKKSFIEMCEYFQLLIRRKISDVILTDKSKNENRVLSDLLYQLKAELIQM